MVHVDSIGNLKRMVVNPRAFRVVRDIGGWCVLFQWVKDQNWFEIRTARGSIKVYKTIDSAMKEIWSVWPNQTAIVYPYFYDSGN